MNNFKKSSEYGDNKLTELFCSLGFNIELADDKYSIFDAIVSNDDEKYLIETKERSFEFPDYIMELKKINNLYEKAKELECKGIIYVNTFPNNKAIMWNITTELLGKSKKMVM